MIISFSKARRHAHANSVPTCLKLGIYPCGTVGRAGKEEVTMERRRLDAVHKAVMCIEREVDGIPQ